MSNNELYNHIYCSLVKHRKVETPEDKLFVHELTLEACEGAEEYLRDLEEANEHLKESVKRLSRES